MKPANPNPAILPAAGRPYWNAVLPQVPRLLSLLDRSPHSRSFGSFDREHWSWKFRDFPLGMAQTAAYPLALLWKHPWEGSPYFRNEQLLTWIGATFQQTLSRQHSHGAFDAFGPNECESGTTLGVIHGLCEAFRVVRDELPGSLTKQFLESAQRAFQFALHHPEVETHAFVSNHWALFAVAFLDAHELLGDPAYQTRAGEIVSRILREQFPEGCYCEYGGADPGYESLGLHHLAAFWQRTGRTDLLESLRRSIEFYAHWVHPDGSVGGVYGSRNTQLFFPAAFEILRAQIPLAGAVADFMRARVERNAVVTPALADTENLVPLTYSYLEAALHAEEGRSASHLPHQELQGTSFFEKSGLLASGSPAYYAVMSPRKGGVTRVFAKPSGELVYEDAGYIAESSAGKCISQRLLGSQVRYSEAERSVAVRGTFSAFDPLLPTPVSFLLLRLFQLTIGRIAAFARMARNWIVRRLILAAAPGFVQLERSVRFLPDRIEFRDALHTTVPVPDLRLTITRRLTAFHMGSANYFHASELAQTPLPDASDAAGQLARTGSASLRFTLWFDAAGARLAQGDAVPQRDSNPSEVLSSR